MDDIKDLYCANCGGWYGIHNYRTMQCPVGGREAPEGRKQEWKDTTFVAITEPQTMTHQAEPDAQAARIAALEAVLRDNEKTLKFACSVANQMRESGLYDACLASLKATRAALKG